MTFANQKEETLNLELTSYGRYLLSLGKFKPHQYAFFDDDIIYDRQFVGTGSSDKPTELQNDIEGRIQEETPRLKPQSIYRGAEVGVFSENAAHVNNLMPGVVAASEKKSADFLLETADSSYIYSEPLGNSAFNSNNVAAWDIAFYKNYLNSATMAWTGSNDVIPTTFIPQLNSNIQYEAHFYPPDPDYKWEDEPPQYLYDFADENVAGNLEIYDNLNIPYKLDGNSGYITVFDDYAVLKVEEANTDFEKENFEVEVFLVESEAVNNNPEVLSKLYFYDGLGDPTKKHIEYFFQIEVDFEIDEEEFCDLRGNKEKVKNIYTDNIFNCSGEGTLGLGQANIYGTAENQEIGDVCD
tara:strand:- start:20824 stop:21885 length:1062 start_codon:yes stop_codon:yes gene_type:complete